MKHSLIVVSLLFALAIPGRAEPLLKSENIFPVGGKHAHSSSVVECPDGGLLCCWFYGSGERTGTDVVVQGARWKQGASRWSPVFVMADTTEAGRCIRHCVLNTEWIESGSP